MNLTDVAEEKNHNSGAYKDGYDAYWSGILSTANPYSSVFSAEYQLWNSGWMDAKDLDESVDDNGC